MAVSKQSIPFSLDDVGKIKQIKNLEISPDGKIIIYTVNVPNVKENKREDYIFLTEIRGKKTRSIAKGFSPIWSPDNKFIAYKASKDGKYGLWLYDIQQDHSKFLVPIYESGYFINHMAKKNFEWSPDGKKIAYISTIPFENSDVNQNIRVIDNLMYKSIGGRKRPFYANQPPCQIWLISIKDRQSEILTNGDSNKYSISWSPDGKEIAFVSNKSSNPDYNHKNDLWSVNIRTKKIDRYTRESGTVYHPAWSPDREYIAYLANKGMTNSKDSPSEDFHIYIKSSSDGDSICLTKSLDRRIKSIEWHPNGEDIYFTAEDKGRESLYKVGIKSKKIEKVIAGDFKVSEYAISQSAKNIVYIKSDMIHFPEIYIQQRDGKSSNKLTKQNERVSKERYLQDAETLWFNSFDDLQIQGWIIKPASFNQNKKYPLILTIHGGPHNMFGYEFKERAQTLVGQGYAVLFINPRGSSGYGQQFSRGSLLNWGGGDYKDLMNGVEYVLDRYKWIDKERLGVTGHSYGGYMTNWIISQTSMFKAAVSDGGVSNLISFSGTSIFHLLIENEFNGKPWKNFPLLWQWSPLRNVDKVSTPTLFLHGETDNEVPITQAEEMFTALKKAGVETQLIQYIGEGHGCDPDLKPLNRIDLYQRMIKWFDTYLKLKTK
ncbi:S9 family peptidase [Schnuerera sp.]|uniref:S9 family peptidase n=1 Tax=Schnuerera sp. TaxID=2794844 RepID=UPI002D17E0FF|nr:S9 family peptidase [Schnuerera sp.]HSH35152.1 S9 family peptidase [Schnuerera sp.]